MSGPATAARPPLVALVGRPNVGKSTLFNRLVGRRTALVDDRPGATRDRIFGEAKPRGKVLRVVDTGGLDMHPGDSLLSRMRAQTELAIDEADLVVLVLDATEGLCPADRQIATMLRRAGKPTVLAVNKVDVPAHEDRAFEFHELGFDQLVAVSAEHGRHVDELCDLLCERLSPPDAEELEAATAPLPVSPAEPEGDATSRVEWAGGPVWVAVVGRPNAGKSSLVNALIGQERLLTTEVPGTTRDPIDTHVEHDGQPFVLIDTAGIRRKRAIDSRLEHFAVVKAFQSMDRADVVLMLLDATLHPSDQDGRVARMAHDKGKGLVLVTNKWDLVENPDWREPYLAALRKKLGFASYAPIHRVSAQTGRGLHRLFGSVLAVQSERHRRVGTGELNRFFKEVVEAKPPPARGRKRPRLFFVSQPLVRPPTFVFSVSRADDIQTSYQRYLSNALRERYGFVGTPIWLKFRPRGKNKS